MNTFAISSVWILRTPTVFYFVQASNKIWVAKIHFNINTYVYLKTNNETEPGTCINFINFYVSCLSNKSDLIYFQWTWLKKLSQLFIRHPVGFSLAISDTQTNTIYILNINLSCRLRRNTSQSAEEMMYSVLKLALCFLGLRPPSNNYLPSPGVKLFQDGSSAKSRWSKYLVRKRIQCMHPYQV